MAELKPCDCGQAHPFIEMEDFFKIGWRYYIWCPSCNTESDLYETEEQAIDAWNKRQLCKQKAHHALVYVVKNAV